MSSMFFNTVEITGRTTPRMDPINSIFAGPYLDCVYNSVGGCFVGIALNMSTTGGIASQALQKQVFDAWEAQLPLVQSGALKGKLVTFDTPELMEKVYSKNESMVAGVVLDASNYPERVIYGIRMDRSYLPAAILPSRPSLFLPPFSQILGGAKEFSSSGFAFLQVAADTAIANVLASNATLPPLDIFQSRPFLELNVTASSWPRSKLVTGMLLVAIPTYMVFPFILGALLISTELVTDRVTKLKEYLKIMGMRESSYWVSAALSTAIVLSVPLVILIVATSVLNFFGPYFGLGILHLFFFFLATIAYILFVAAVAPSAMVSKWMISLYIFGSLVSVLAVNIPLGARVALSIFPPINFQLSMINLVKQKAAYMIGPTREIPASLETIPDFPAYASVPMLVFDTVFYLVLAWYFAQVLGGTSDYVGAPKPWNFPFTRAYWSKLSKKRSKSSSNIGNSRKEDEIEDEEDDLMDESETAVLLNGEPNINLGERRAHRNPAHFESFQSNASDLRISTRNLIKRYPGAEVNAVDRLDLDIFQGIYVLLGENGSGKSTTISMLTGLTSITSGAAEVDGADVGDQIDFVRDSISICPQHDLLSHGLTGAEHLRLFAMLKGVPSSQVDSRVAETIADVGLSGAENQTIDKYSGGMKRSLSLGISLIAQSRITFIDEASSGMDMEKRRTLWDMLLRKKAEGATLVLTTHYMEEAEILGDRIGIMNRGHLVREGSLEFLKRELGYQIHAEGADTQILPLSQRDELPGILKTLESTHKSVSVSTPNLEEVFVQLCKTLDQSEDAKALASPQLKYDSLSHLGGSKQPSAHPRPAGRFQQARALYSKRARMDSRKWGQVLAFFIIPLLVMTMGLLISRMSSSYFKEIPLAMEQAKSNGETKQFELGMGSKSPLVIPYSTPSSAPAHQLLDPWISNTLKIDQIGNTLDDLSEYLWSNNSKSAYLAKVAGLFIHQVGPVSPAPFSIYSYGIQFNQTDSFSLPSMINFMSNVVLRHYLGTTSTPADPLQPVIVVRSVPFPDRSQSDFSSMIYSLLTNLSTMNTQFITMACIAIAVLASIHGKEIAEEYEMQLIHQFQRAGMAASTFWASSLAYFWSKMSIAAILMVSLVAIFRFKYLEGPVFIIFAVSLLLQTWTSTTVSVVLAKLFFRRSASAQKYLILCLLALATLPVLISSLLRTFSSLSQSARFLATIADIVNLISPMTICTATVTALSTAYATTFTQLSLSTATAMKYAGLPLIVHFAQLFFWVGLLIVTEIYASKLRTTPGDETDKQKQTMPAPRTSLLSSAPLVQDAPVALYNDDHSNGGDAIVLDHIWKRYPGSQRRAVVDSSLSIPNGMCFGLLGPNGAGKSTTISMIIGDVSPSGGQYHIAGNAAIGEKKSDLYQKVRLSCCPQTNALYTDLTVKEHIELFLLLRNNAVDFDLAEQTREILERMRLVQHAHKVSDALSGGNKRKLCTAIAALTFNDVVILDEPSTGCDPSMRRTLWSVIKQEQASKGLILTTHSMDEADAVCNRLAIMINGQIVSVGTPQQLKSQCGGYELHTWFNPSANISQPSQAINSGRIDDIEKNVLQPRFQNLRRVESDTNSKGVVCIKYDIGSIASIADTFEFLQNRLKGGAFDDYMLTQTTLGTAYQRLVREQHEDAPDATV